MAQQCRSGACPSIGCSFHMPGQDHLVTEPSYRRVGWPAWVTWSVAGVAATGLLLTIAAAALSRRMLDRPRPATLEAAAPVTDARQGPEPQLATLPDDSAPANNGATDRLPEDEESPSVQDIPPLHTAPASPYYAPPQPPSYYAPPPAPSYYVSPQPPAYTPPPPSYYVPPPAYYPPPSYYAAPHRWRELPRDQPSLGFGGPPPSRSAPQPRYYRAPPQASPRSGGRDG